MKTAIDEKTSIKLRKPTLIEGLPGLGMVGRIATRYLAKQLKAERFALLHSPHFPYYVIVDKKGSARLLRGEFRY
ncbi:MAG: PAC2 family protein, partial [Candidatus Bathyarchaeota archaeon]|nr:PAC2 family protein [Candidatus Bathyarchaeota archaeon]